MKGVVLFSGGLDSTTLLWHALQMGLDEIFAVTCIYGSKHNERELMSAKTIAAEAARTFADKCRVRHKVVELPNVFTGGNSALMSEAAMPQLTYHELSEAHGPSPTVVPFRNANLISIATAIAAARDFDYVFIATHAEDARNWAYPDCTPEFLGAMANAVYVGTYNRTRLQAPFTWMMKTDIVRLAASMRVPLDVSYSCYEGRSVHCGKCPTCIERHQAFLDAGYDDPTIYDIDMVGSLTSAVALKPWPV